jgi:hypothetical protein
MLLHLTVGSTSCPSDLTHFRESKDTLIRLSLVTCQGLSGIVCSPFLAILSVPRWTAPPRVT